MAERIDVSIEKLRKSWSFHVNSDGTITLTIIRDDGEVYAINGLRKEEANVMAVSPMLLQLLLPSMLRENSPMWLDIDRVLERAGIRIKP